MYLYWEIAFFNLSQPSPHAVTLIGGSLDAGSISYCDWVHFQFYYRHEIKTSGRVIYMHKEREGLSYLPCFSKYQIKHILHALRFSKFLILKSVSVYLSGRFISPCPSELCIYVLWDNKERRTAKSRNVWIVLYNYKLSICTAHIAWKWVELYIESLHRHLHSETCELCECTSLQISIIMSTSSVQCTYISCYRDVG